MPLSPWGLRGDCYSSGNSVHYPERMEREMGFLPLCIPTPWVCLIKAALWLSGQAQGRDTICVEDRVSALVLVRWRGSILWLYLLKAQKGLSVDTGDGASVDCP